MQTKRSNSARIQRPQGAMALAGYGANEARCHRGRDWRGQVHILENIIAQDMTRRFGARRMPMIIFDGKGERSP